MLFTRWLVEGNPQVILFDIGSAAYKLDEFKQVELLEISSIHFKIKNVKNFTMSLSVFNP